MKPYNGRGSAGVINYFPQQQTVNANRLLNTVVKPDITTDGVLTYRDANWITETTEVTYVIDGLRLVNNASNRYALDINAGSCMTTIGKFEVAKLNGLLTKRLDQAWVAGNNVGGNLDIAHWNANFATAGMFITYHVFIIKSPAGVVDIAFDRSLIATNRPLGWTARRIGSIMYFQNMGGIVRFVQYGYYFELDPICRTAGGYAIPAGLSIYYSLVPDGIAPVVQQQLFTGFSEFVQNGGSDYLNFNIGSSNQTLQAPAWLAAHTDFTGVASVYGNFGNGFYTFIWNSITTQVKSNPSRTYQIYRTGTYYNTNVHFSNLQNLGWFDRELLIGK